MLVPEFPGAVVITADVELAGLACGEVKEGLKQLVDPCSLLGVAKRSSLETASRRPLSLLISVVFGEVPEPEDVVTSARLPMVLESGPIRGEFKLLNSEFLTLGFEAELS